MNLQFLTTPEVERVARYTPDPEVRAAAREELKTRERHVSQAGTPLLFPASDLRPPPASLALRAGLTSGAKR